jgi:hypothetical protein
MIQLTVTSSTDEDKIGQFTFYKNLIYIGAHKSCDLYLNDKALDKNHIFIEIVDSKLLVHLGQETPKILINGKITTGHKFITPGITLDLNGNTLKVDSFIETIDKSYKEELNSLTEEIIENQPKVLEFLQELQQS